MNRAAALALALGAALPAAAQQAPGGGPWSVTVDGFGAYQAPADLDDGGDLSVGRIFGQVGVSRVFDPRNRVGLSVGGGATIYEFGGGAEELFGTVNDLRLSLPILFSAGERATVTLVPSLRFNAEEGADLDSGQSEGAFAAVTWRLNDRLTIGPGVGVFSDLDGDSANAFPILAIDWQISDRWSLSTLRGVGASQGPGLTLGYEVDDGLSLGIAGRFESTQFRLDDDGIAPGGIGEDETFPLVASVTYAPGPGLSASGFLGVELGGELTVRDTEGDVVERRDYDPAAILGGQLTLRF